MSDLSVEEQITQKFTGEQAPESAPTEPEVDTAEQVESEEQPRDEAGKFAPKDDAPASEAEEAEPVLLAGKYKDTAELEKAYEAAQTLIGRQGNELAEARALRSEFEQLREQLKPEPRPSYDPDSIDEYLAANPQNIPALAQQALETSDNYLYQRTLEAWGELDRVGAMDFHANAVADAKIAELEKRLTPQLEASRQVATSNEFQAAFDNRAQHHPDFAAVLDTLTQETLDGFPKQILATLQSGDQESKEQVLETLYRWQKAEQAGTLQQAVATATQQAQQDALTARQEAAVASTTGSQDRVPVTGIDSWREQFQNSDAFKKAAGLI